MFLSQAISKSGLGQRLAYAFISIIGRSPLGLVYSLVFRYGLHRIQASNDTMLAKIYQQ